MKILTAEVIETLKGRGLLPSLPEGPPIPLPAVNKVELYLSFHCNDRCAHCVTTSGPERQETLSPDDAITVIKHVAQFSVLRQLDRLFGKGEFRCALPQQFLDLEARKVPPKRLSESLKTAYVDCLQGNGCNSQWITGSLSFNLNFGRPSIRISGGEFFMWPARTNGKELSDNQRLDFQGQLLREIRTLLPDYDVWILTNGRFAVSREHADKVIEAWARHANSPNAGGKTRICISVDVFHRPPPGSSVEEMLDRIWAATRKYGLSAPFLYGIPNDWIGYLGRVFGNFKVGRMKKHTVKNVSGSSFNPVMDLMVDPLDLVGADGCREVKGFYLRHSSGVLIANNIYIAPSGHMVYCCACLGSYGDFVREPKRCLENLVRDPISLMLRRAETAISLLNTAVELDPTIKVLGTGEYPAVTGSTCYQLMTGKRLP
ncbi:MAG: radical SAM protein [Desulfovibrionales bacterium]|nr:radical SAM protein [Desulfovibrionales bacterium]